MWHYYMKETPKENQIRENANKIRAEIIGKAIEVEDALTLTLGYLYCPLRKSQYVYLLVEDILTDLTFEKKIKIFKKFVTSFPSSFSHQAEIMNYLNEIREKRNNLAHRNIRLPWIFGEEDINDEGYNKLTNEYVDWM